MNGATLLTSSVVPPGEPAPGGVRSRPLLLLERTMYRDGRTPFTSVFPIQVAGELEEGRLRHALARVQARHPLLRCAVEGIAEAPRFVLLDRHAPIPLRIVERIREDDWQTVVRQEWVTPFEDREPLVRLVWLRGREVSELVLLAHHAICDGHTGINLLRELLSVYDQPERDLGTYDTLGGIEDLVPAALLQDPRFRRRVRWKAAILRLSLLLNRKSASPPGQPLPAGAMYFLRWNIGRESARTLTGRCRSEGVTVLGAASVAFMQAFRDVCGVRGLGKASAMVNARRFLPRLHADAMFGLSPGIALRTRDLPPPREMDAIGFWARARAVKTDLTSRIERFAAGLYEMLAALENLHDRYAGIIAHFENAPAIRNLTLSNVGRLDLPGQYRNFRVERIYSPLVMVSPTPANTIVISSFAGEMEFAIISDEQSLPQPQALEIRHRAMEILWSCAALPQPDRLETV